MILKGPDIRRTTLGLEIRISSGASALTTDQKLFSDDTFEYSSSELNDLIEYIQKKRPDIARRILSGDTVSLLIPQADPPIIRVTAKPGHSAYFNLGELWRWRFLKQLPDYPFKNHQTTGVKWLRQCRFGVLADDMGLGKTLQAIAAMEAMHRAGEIKNTLIVCPKSLIGVWEAEITLWAPRFCTVALHSSVSTKEWQIISVQCQVAITNYEAIRRTSPEPGSFELVVFDEIHKLKNPKSLNYRAAYCLQPRLIWGLSGTPLENEAGDLSAILHLLDRKKVALSDSKLSTASLQSLASKYILRRDRKVISEELPKVIETTEFIPLTLEQRNAYNKILRENVTVSMGDWIAKFNRLRDICDSDPSSGKSSKLERASVIIGAINKLGEKVVVFSWRIEPLRLLYRRLVKQHGSACAEIITGQTKSTVRSKLVESFQNSDFPFVLLCSTRATAEGITLTAANHVIFLNEWWNPSINKQARDRVNRIGQTRTVYIYRLRSLGTIESRLDEILKTKAGLFDKIVNQITKNRFSTRDRVPEELVQLLAEKEPQQNVCNDNLQ